MHSHSVHAARGFERFCKVGWIEGAAETLLGRPAAIHPLSFPTAATATASAAAVVQSRVSAERPEHRQTYCRRTRTTLRRHARARPTPEAFGIRPPHKCGRRRSRFQSPGRRFRARARPRPLPFPKEGGFSQAAVTSPLKTLAASATAAAASGGAAAKLAQVDVPKPLPVVARRENQDRSAGRTDGQGRTGRGKRLRTQAHAWQAGMAGGGQHDSGWLESAEETAHEHRQSSSISHHTSHR